MAKVVEHIPKTRGRRAIYPWDQWLDGQKWELTQGEDFQVKPVNMHSPIKSAAIYRGLSVEIHVRGDKVYIQASKPTEATS